MRIIPVIDVRFGLAVRAVAGDRATYRRLATPLVATDGAAGSTALAVARGYRRLYPFSALYVADLDGIEGRGANSGLAPSLAAELPDVDVWIDAGGGDEATTSGVSNVIGSETLSDHDVARIASSSAVLSLDFRGEDFLGPPVLLQRADLWPPRVIVMTLARVGTNAGPDLKRIAEIARRATRAEIYAAGGIRDVEDLKAARAAGAHGALVASALHAGKIKADDLDEIVGL